MCPSCRASTALFAHILNEEKVCQNWVNSKKNSTRKCSYISFCVYLYSLNNKSVWVVFGFQYSHIIWWDILLYNEAIAKKYFDGRQGLIKICMHSTKGNATNLILNHKHRLYKHIFKKQNCFFYRLFLHGTCL